jgi:hypothetical protein
VFAEINTTGTVFVRIVSKTGVGCADFWWVKWPFGYTQQLGRHCGAARFDIPSVFSITVASKLRAGGITTPVKIGTSVNETSLGTASVDF